MPLPVKFAANTKKVAELYGNAEAAVTAKLLKKALLEMLRAGKGLLRLLNGTPMIPGNLDLKQTGESSFSRYELHRATIAGAEQLEVTAPKAKLLARQLRAQLSEKRSDNTTKARPPETTASSIESPESHSEDSDSSDISPFHRR